MGFVEDLNPGLDRQGKDAPYNFHLANQGIYLRGCSTQVITGSLYLLPKSPLMLRDGSVQHFAIDMNDHLNRAPEECVSHMIFSSF